jgi:DNA repair exonuclease SbcCD nuclease subunit
MRDAGSAVRLESTTTALDELMMQLDASGFVKGEVRGALWDFKRDGVLPFERDNLPSGERIPVDEEVIEQLAGELIDQEKAIAIEESDIGEEWEELPSPSDDDDDEVVTPNNIETKVSIPSSDEDERAALEEELARLDARWIRRSEPVVESAGEVALNALEDELDGIDL